MPAPTSTSSTMSSSIAERVASRAFSGRLAACGVSRIVKARLRISRDIGTSLSRERSSHCLRFFLYPHVVRPTVRIPLSAHAALSSSISRLSTPSEAMSSSSSFNFSMCWDSTHRMCVFEPNGLSPMYWHMLTSCGRGMVSKVRSSLNTFATLRMSSFPTRCPFLTIASMSTMSSLELLSASLDLTSSFTVSCKKLAICSRAWRSFFNLSSFSWDFLKLDGSIFGKSLNATGSRNSMKGMMIKMEKGTRRNISTAVRRNILRSRRVSLFPRRAV
mmetsp:Transcript_13092/g.26678  ORF Transcript_13092/g.26678 Transcript_13092/m.26678 type:complete len:274 (-) Transcript_13092:652-1473(-)